MAAGAAARAECKWHHPPNRRRQSTNASNSTPPTPADGYLRLSGPTGSAAVSARFGPMSGTLLSANEGRLTVLLLAVIR